MTFPDTPFIVPVAGLAVVALAIVFSVLNQAYARRLATQQRLAMLQRGLTVAEMERLIGMHDEPRPIRSHARSMAFTRRAAAMLVSFGIGLALFFIALATLLHESNVLSGAAVSFIPLCLGIGFAVEHRLQSRDAETPLDARNTLA